MEKGCLRMGMNNSFFLPYIKEKLNIKDFLVTQSHWGHTKNRTHHLMNVYILGFKNSFSLFNPYFSCEYLVRSLVFCSKVLLSKGNLLFICDKLSNNKSNIVSFFSFRSLQFIYLGEWSYGHLLRNFLKNFSALIIPSLDEKSFILKESLKSFIPLISIEDSDYKSLKPLFSFLGNDNSKVSLSYFYNCISDCILKTLLFDYFTHLK